MTRASKRLVLPLLLLVNAGVLLAAALRPFSSVDDALSIPDDAYIALNLASPLSKTSLTVKRERTIASTSESSDKSF